MLRRKGITALGTCPHTLRTLRACLSLRANLSPPWNREAECIVTTRRLRDRCQTSDAFATVATRSKEALTPSSPATQPSLALKMLVVRDVGQERYFGSDSIGASMSSSLHLHAWSSVPRKATFKRAVDLVVLCEKLTATENPACPRRRCGGHTVAESLARAHQC
jgi:hypothetical protein